jgi:hypothetical protein
LSANDGLPTVSGVETGYYTLELVRPEGGWSRLPELVANAREASEQLTREGTAVRFVRSVFVPEDETCFYLYEAPSTDAVREAARRASLACGPITETLTEPE